MTYAEQLKALREKKAEHTDKMKSLVDKSAEAGETLGGDDAELFDTLTQEIESLDAQIKRVETLERMTAAEAAPVQKSATQATASASRVPAAASSRVSVSKAEEPGAAFGRVAKCLMKCKGDLMLAERLAEKEFSHDQRVVNIVKAAVAAGSTSDPTWIGALVGEEGKVFQDFLEYLRPQTIIGQFGQGNIPALLRASFRVPMISQTSGGAGYWVGEGAPKPLTKFDFDRTTLEPTKVANIAVLTMEAVRDSSPNAELIVRDQLVAALQERLDIDFIDPLKAASSGVSPASVTNGVTPITSSGTDAASVRKDIRALMASYLAARNPPRSGVLVMNSLTALALSQIDNGIGQKAFPNVGLNGGVLDGIPVLVSDYVPAYTAGSIVVMINASDIYIADEGGFTLDSSREASLQMVDNPSTGATSLVSLWQNNLVGILAERTISWAKRRPSAVAYLDGVNWGGAI